MSISICPSNFIVNPVMETGRFRISNFLLGMVRFVNDTDEKMELYELSFEIFAVSKPVKKIVYSGEALVSKISNGKDNLLLLPGEEVIIRKEHFSVVSGSAVDMLDVIVSYRQSGAKKSEHLSIPVVNY